MGPTWRPTPMARISCPPPSLQRKPSTRVCLGAPSTLQALASKPTLPLLPSPLSATARAVPPWLPSSTRPWPMATLWPTPSVRPPPSPSSTPRLPRALTRRPALLLLKLISRQTLQTMGRDQRRAEKPPRPISACFECYLFFVHHYLVLEKLEINFVNAK